MSYIPERGSTHVYKVNKISKEEIHTMAEMCVFEQLPSCNAACPLLAGELEKNHAPSRTVRCLSRTSRPAPERKR